MLRREPSGISSVSTWPGATSISAATLSDGVVTPRPGRWKSLSLPPGAADDFGAAASADVEEDGVGAAQAKGKEGRAAESKAAKDPQIVVVICTFCKKTSEDRGTCTALERSCALRYCSARAVLYIYVAFIMICNSG